MHAYIRNHLGLTHFLSLRVAAYSMQTVGGNLDADAERLILVIGEQGSRGDGHEQSHINFLPYTHTPPFTILLKHDSDSADTVAVTTS